MPEESQLVELCIQDLQTKYGKIVVILNKHTRKLDPRKYAMIPDRRRFTSGRSRENQVSIITLKVKPKTAEVELVIAWGIRAGYVYKYFLKQEKAWQITSQKIVARL